MDTVVFLSLRSILSFQVIDEDSDNFIGPDTRDNIRTPSPPICILLSDDELPDLSPPKNTSFPQKALCDVKRKPNTETTKKQSTLRENLKRKKGNIEKPPVNPCSITDFVEITEPACNIAILNDSSMKPLLKSQQETLNSTKSAKSKEPQTSSMPKIDPMNNCFVPMAPSLENISNLLDDLKAQGFQGSSLNLFDLSDKWDEEFNKVIKQADVLSSSKTLGISVNFQTGVFGIQASSSLPQNDQTKFVHSSPEKTDHNVNEKEVSSSPELGTISAQRSSQLSNNFSSLVSHHKGKHSPKPFESPRLKKHQNLKSSTKERNENILSISFHDDSLNKIKTLKGPSSIEPAKDNSKLATSYGDLFADFSQSFDDVTELVDKSCPLQKKSNDGSSEPKKQKLEIPSAQDSSNPDISIEEIHCEDDLPVFDLTTDIFSDDKSLDSTEAKSICVKTPATDSNYILKVSSNTSPSSPVTLDKDCHTSKLSSLIVSFVNTKIPTSAENGNLNTEEDNLPLFDLELDFDAIPPTPEPENPHSLSSKASQFNLKFSSSIPLQNKAMFSSESHSIIQNKSSAVGHEYFSLSSDEELPALNVIGHSQHQSTPLSKKKAALEQPSTPHFNTKKDTFSLHQNKEESFSSSFSSGGFDLKFDELLDNVTEVSVPLEKPESKSVALIDNSIYLYICISFNFLKLEF